ncbi:MAG: IS110 family transposase [Actinomycetota bacterium]|jgi:transposase|nr:IS110 family transposase [Actinomycetota bacterium]
MGDAGVVNANRMIAADVHAAGSWLAGIELATGEVWSRRVTGPPSRVAEVVAAMGPGSRLVYEAGPTGFGLARVGAERGIDVVVCAPGSVPRAAGDRVKTDRRDAQWLLGQWRAGAVSPVRVPSLAEESFRDLVRAREDARGDVMRHRHRLSKFLLRRELRPRARVTTGAWSIPWMNWVRSLRFDELGAQATFTDYLAAVEGALQRRTVLDQALEDGWPASPWAQTIARLRCFRGIDTLSACGIAAEIGDFTRFSRPDRLSGFLGIVPSEHSSGQRQRRGQITKAGPGHARRLLVEAAHQYRHRPRIGEPLERRQRGQDPRVVAVAWRCQQRLHRRWRQLLVDRGKPAGVVTVAMARELAAFCWEAAIIQ